jgi:hypothetical protein
MVDIEIASVPGISPKHEAEVHQKRPRLAAHQYFTNVNAGSRVV